MQVRINLLTWLQATSNHHTKISKNIRYMEGCGYGGVRREVDRLIKAFCFQNKLNCQVRD